ncbi:neprilysin-1-like isoform X2 [Limulus polyphemus]|uniref:Neprilysin-1-like isoform X2 n=1 Tax=Limulus polyphemus TaxID=6850 RepID=A0ABM1TID6_LIMPO|nr:neprilysin-1-like isoform X2 [Limulus polyphemus]
MSMPLRDSRSYLTNDGEGCWKRKTGLEQKLTILLGIFLVVTISLVIAVSAVAVKYRSISASQPTEIPPKPSAVICNTTGCKNTALELERAMNTNVHPCDDFYEYACGGWISSHKIPETKSRYGTFDQLRENLSNVIVALLENTTDSKSAVGKSRNIYHACKDEAKRDELGIDPLINLLEKFGGWPLNDSEQGEIGSYTWTKHIPEIRKQLSVNIMMSFYVHANPYNTKEHIIYLDQPSFGIGQRQLMEPDNENNRKIIDAYKIYIKESLKILKKENNSEEFDSLAEEIFKFESDLAKHSVLPEDRRDPRKVNTIMKVSDISKNITDIDWESFLNAYLPDSMENITSDSEVNVRDIDLKYLRGLALVIKNNTNSVIGNYVGWRLVQVLGPLTTEEFRKIEFDFKKVTQGVQELESLELVCANLVNSLMPEAVGRLYVEEQFKAQSKQETKLMVEELHEAFKVLVRLNDWMDVKTKEDALNKADQMIDNIGYPEWIKNDDELNKYFEEIKDISTENFFNDYIKILGVLSVEGLKQLDKPYDREKWITGAAVVNAFYSPLANSISFPAGILQTPFFSSDRPVAMNFGGIGMVIGHEITHGFDDQGSLYDGEGNIKLWWTKDTREKFDERAKCFINQYNNYKDDTTKLNLNGKNTLGENIADNGGLREAYKGYQTYVFKYGDKAKNYRLPGDKFKDITPDQLFFLAFANVWCSNARPQYIENMIQYDTHSPPKYRVWGPLSNFEQFAQTFNCKEGDTMVKPAKDRCAIW